MPGAPSSGTTGESQAKFRDCGGGGCRYVAKCSSDPPGSLHRSQSSGTGPGVNGHRRPVPGAPSSDTPQESQAKLRVGTVWEVPVGTGGKWVQETCAGCPKQLYAKGEKPGVQDYWGCHVAKRSFDPRIAYPEVKVQVRYLV